MRASTEAELAELVRGATDPLAIRGGGTRGLAQKGEALEVSGLAGITLYEPGALTLVAQAGTTIFEINSVLDAEGQRLAFEPSDLRRMMGADGESTIGGVMSANASGPRRIAVGAARDFALGVRFVDGTGQVIKNGGRVMKNVTGYDLVKLMCGAYGTLGVLTEVALKVLPQPETQCSLVLHGLGDVDAVRAMAAAMGSPFEVTGAAHEGAGKNARTVLRLEGFEASVRYRHGALRDRLREAGAEMSLLEETESAEFWREVRDAAMFAPDGNDVWRVSCKPSEGPDLVARSGATHRLMDWAGGLLWLAVPWGDDLRAALGGFDGHATLVRAEAATRQALGTFHPEAPGVARLSAGLRAKFDPRGILNAGLMGSVS